MLNVTLRWAKRIVALVIGSTVLLVGVVMLVLPGPGLLLILSGLAILAVGAEILWARRLLQRARSSADAVANRVPSHVKHRLFFWRKPKANAAPRPPAAAPHTPDT